MIDIENAKTELKKHVNRLRETNAKVKKKIEHCFRVGDNCREIAKSLKLKEEEIQLAELIGILHDIGRFEQYKIKNKNVKFDHGKAGAELLKRRGYIRKFIKTDEYDDIIINAVYEHSQYALSKNLSQEEKLFSQIVRDADKLDLIYEAIYIYWQEPERIKLIRAGELSKEMLKDFYQEKLANKINRKSETDQILRFASYVYDINFQYSFKVLKETDNVSKMIDRFNYQIPETKLEMQKIKEKLKQYIEEKSKEE